MTPARIDTFTGRYAFLSNFAPYDGRTLEHYFQAEKTLDRAWRRRILAAPTPGMAKRLGRQAPLRPYWDLMRVDVMRWLLADKFAEHTTYGDWLRATGTAELVEGNCWGDRFWGVYEGKGENWLGRLLMAQRVRLTPPVLA